MLNYVYLGDEVADGVFGWVTVGIDPKAVYTPRAAAYVDGNGGHANPGGGAGPPRPSGSGFSPRPTSSAIVSTVV